jgi:hypothetical protein
MPPRNPDHNAVKVLHDVATRSPEPISGGNVSPETMTWLYEHAVGMGKELLEGKSIPEIIISVDVNNAKQLGHFKIGRDGLGLKWRISMNLRHLSRPKGNVLSTLLHEMLHAWQHSEGNPPKDFRTHNTEFRELSAELGIPTDSKGHDLGIKADSPFEAYLKRHKIEGKIGLVEKKLTGKPKGSPLKKWSCQCPVNVRVAVAEFNATCNICGELFELQE